MIGHRSKKNHPGFWQLGEAARLTGGFFAHSLPVATSRSPTIFRTTTLRSGRAFQSDKVGPMSSEEQSPTASSTLNRGVQSLQFDPRSGDRELPVDAALWGSSFVDPDPDFARSLCPCADPTVTRPLAGQATEFARGDVPPTALVRRATQIDPLSRGPRDVRGEMPRRTPPSVWVVRLSQTSVPFAQSA